MVRRLRDFSARDARGWRACPVDELLESVHGHARAERLAFDAERGPAGLFVDRLQIEVVLRNLVANAVESVDGGQPDDHA